MSDDGDPAHSSRAVDGAWVLLLGFLVLFGTPLSARADDPPVSQAGDHPAPADYCNPRFCVHTDLPPDEADALLKRLDATLKGTARFFGAPQRGSVELFVVDRLDQWPSESFTHPAARLLIGGVGGGVVTNGFDDDATAPRTVVVFAAALPGIPEHEIVHAYCLQTFGQSGPTWFKEGIAEMLANGAQEHGPVQCPEEVIAYLRGEEPRTLAEITSAGDEFTAPLTASLVTMLAHHDARHRLGAVASMDEWREEHTEVVRHARLAYHWCWATCHFLHQHPEYNGRFKLLARGFVGGQSVDFDELYAPLRDRLEFEYRFFLEHLAPGYRVDLCAWDWSDPSVSRAGKRQPSIKVAAGRGYQPTGLTVHKGDCVSYEATGAWRLSSDTDALDADGNDLGQGRLEGVLLHEHSLSEPFELGKQGKFTSPGRGQLYLRCRDAWGELADNRGLVRVSFRKSAGP